MGTRIRLGFLAGIVALTIYMVLPSAGPAYAQSGKSNHSKYEGEGGTADKPADPEPYGGQIYCPVTGIKLGLDHPPSAVQTSIGEVVPGFWGKLFGQKPKPGAVIYVCSSQCADKVRQNPAPYLDEIIADKGCFSFTYSKAPARRPQRAP